MLARLPNRRPRRAAIMFASMPPPIGGWNRRDAIPLMEPSDALKLDNWIPDTNAVRLRHGSATHATISGTPAAIESLIQYAPPTTANAKLFAALPTAIYDVTASGTVSAAAVSGLSNGRWQHALMANAAGIFLTLVNGADAPRQFDGTSWSSPSITGAGLTAANLIGIHNHMNRLWLIEENQGHVWYLATSAIAGAATKFQLPWKRGGKLLAMGSWTRDGGSGPDDYAVFVSSRGECIIYAGTDPSSATTSALVGVYNIPEPIGRRCLINAGADLGILTSQGLLPLSQILGMTAGAASRAAFTDKISGQFRDQYMATGTAFGWQCIEFPKNNILIINVPIAERVTQHQYVMNINTGAWCRFTGMNAGCWSLLGDNIYFGGNDSVVRKYGVGYQDGAVNIVATLQSAYGIFGGVQEKRFTMARPLFLAPAGYTPPVTIQTDYDTAEPSVSVVAAATGGTQWNAGQWDSFQWAGGAVPSLDWQGVIGRGRAAAIAFGVSAREELTYNGADIGFERGGYL
jgi:hypothetical protein